MEIGYDRLSMYVYILQCSDNSYYIGIATNMERRLKQHLSILKGGAKYTKAHRVVSVMAIWKDKSNEYARKLEIQLKRKLSHADKKHLVENPFISFSEFGIDIPDKAFEYISPQKINELFDFK